MAEGNKVEKKKWDNCNRIINKIYFKNIIVSLGFLLLSFKSSMPCKNINNQITCICFFPS